jgi:hypothetical protein
MGYILVLISMLSIHLLVDVLLIQRYLMVKHKSFFKLCSVKFISIAADYYWALLVTIPVHVYLSFNISDKFERGVILSL